MPDANGRIPPVAYSLSTEKWERIFGKKVEPDLTKWQDPPALPPELAALLRK